LVEGLTDQLSEYFDRHLSVSANISSSWYDPRDKLLTTSRATISGKSSIRAPIPQEAFLYKENLAGNLNKALRFYNSALEWKNVEEEISSFFLYKCSEALNENWETLSKYFGENEKWWGKIRTSLNYYRHYKPGHGQPFPIKFCFEVIKEALHELAGK
jgi:hypothetical protein